VLDVRGGEPAGHLPVHPDVVVGDDVAHRTSGTIAKPLSFTALTPE